MTTNNKSKCKVNSDGSVCLKDILDSFNSCIKEEHAWALCYQCTKYYHDHVKARDETRNPIKEVQQVFLNTDGTVHKKTGAWIGESTTVLICNQVDIVIGIGLIIYAALDHEINDGEEVVISPDLEQLISDMITDTGDQSNASGTSFSDQSQSHHETDDEGIERDAEDAYEAGAVALSTVVCRRQHITLDEVILRCELHLGTLTKSQVEAHYKAVVRALVAEALELSTFLEKVAQGNLPIEGSNRVNLTQLEFSDWARFWMQVMAELRTGVKLKKVNYTKAPIEYELTPYEILMKDIRSCKYNLRKIMVNGSAPSRVTKDAHAIILEFIRSRPPLKKVTDRKLPPQSKILTPREQLLNSIKKGRKLRPVPVPRKSTMNKEQQQQPQQTPPKPAARRLIKVDFSQFDDDIDDDVETVETPDSSEPGLWASEYQEICDGTALDVYDLATRDCGGRRNTLVVADTPIGCYSVPQSRPGSRQSCNSNESESAMPMAPEVARAIQEQLTDATQWQHDISLDDRLSLTLSEIVHIRTVLTKAELEALPVEGRVRHDVESRKVCFLCLKTRFGIFGPWGQRCTLCKRTVCQKCCTKMHIPMEHFSGVPVVLLSPSIMATPEDEGDHSRFGAKKISDASSPDRLGSSMESSVISDPGTSSTSSDRATLSRFRTRAQQVGRATRAVDRIKSGASPMAVCHDCRMMVLQIIKSANANRSAVRNKTLQSLTLNLSPVY